MKKFTILLVLALTIAVLLYEGGRYEMGKV